MNCDILVVGAGLAGCTAARYFAERGKSVLIVERLPHIAGHCYDEQNEAGITVHLYGPHIFHTNEREVWNFVNRFSGFRYYQHRVLSYAEGRCYPFPINLDTLNLIYGTKLNSREVESFLREEAAASDFNDPPQNFRDVVVSQVGERLYELFFKNYTIKQWGRDPSELSADVAKRIPVRTNRDDRYFSDRYQGIPLRGYTAMVRSMVNHPSVRLLLNADYFDIREEVHADFTVYTGELDRYFDYAHGKLEYRSLDFDLKTFDVQKYQETAVVNYPNDYDWTRVTEYKHLSGEETEKTTVSFEYPKPEGEPYYVVLSKENIEKRENYMREVGELERKGRFLFVGRLAEYAYYNMDQVIAAVFAKLRAY